MKLSVNGRHHDIPTAWQDDTLLFVLREHLGLLGAKFGCGSGQGLAAETGKPPRDAHVPLAQKRDLAEALLARHGPLALLRVGEAIEGVTDEPMQVVFTLARGPHDLLARWQRLERFIHSRHRTRIEASDSRRLELRHVALAPHPPPRPAEDLLVFGVLLALFRLSGARELRARPLGTRQWRLRGDHWHGTGYAGDLSCWQIEWAAVERSERRPPAPAADLPEAARRAMTGDPGRGWTVAALAEELHLSRRSLQRRLQEQGETFSEVLARSRVNAASNLLGTTSAGLAEVAYACGFADQAHLTRDFKRQVGTTPARFRDQFAADRRG